MKKILRVLSKTESMISLMFCIQQIITIFYIDGFDWFKVAAIVILIIGIIYIAMITAKGSKELKSEKSRLALETEIAILLQNDKLKQKFRNSPFYSILESKSKELDFYFIEFSEKYPELSCKQLKTIIKSKLSEFN